MNIGHTDQPKIKYHVLKTVSKIGIYKIDIFELCLGVQRFMLKYMALSGRLVVSASDSSHSIS